jgi:exportin-7
VVDKFNIRLDGQDASDGELAARVFSLLQVVDSGYHQQRYGEKSRQRLDIALLTFFQNFRKVYVGETVMHASKVCFMTSACMPGVYHLKSSWIA